MLTVNYFSEKYYLKIIICGPEVIILHKKVRIAMRAFYLVDVERIEELLKIEHLVYFFLIILVPINVVNRKSLSITKNVHPLIFHTLSLRVIIILFVCVVNSAPPTIIVCSAQEVIQPLLADFALSFLLHNKKPY